MKIIRLEAENVKRLRAVEIVPDPENNLVVISGKNSQGKTSVLDSILYALGGTRAIQEQPIRKGEKAARTLVELDDFVIERKWTSNEKSYLTVKPKGQDAKMSSPQKVLDELVGELSFDPLAFSRMPPREQRQLLIGLADFDFETLETELDNARELRSAERVSRDRARANAEAMEKPDVKDSEPVDVSALMAKIREGREHNDVLRRGRANLEATRDRIREIDQEILRLHQEREQRVESCDNLANQLGGQEEIDVSAYENQVEQAQEHNDAVNQLRRWEEAQSIARQAERGYRKARQRVDAVEEKKRKQIAESDLPVEGLGFTDHGVTFNDVPFDQLGSAEQLRVSLGMAMALNPKARVIRILDGSLLDQESLAIVREMADEKDYQIWVEVVDESGQVGIVIEDGAVKAAKEAALED